ncbi:LicD family protein [Candidatus Saccharibacteria bacterium]|nr:LicD family protein [Candidatus Saccharibacteria bacterium]
MKKYLITNKHADEIFGNSQAQYNLEDLHDEILKIYKEFKRICDKNNLRYFAEGATWVGAMLCEAILPNDDDLDIRMPRKDFEKLLQIAPQELPNYLELCNYTSYPYSRANMAKIMNKKTTFIENSKRITPMEWGGVFVDIVPYDNAPDDWRERDYLHNKGARLYIYNILRKKNEIKLNLLYYKTRTWWYWLGVENDVKLPSNIITMLGLYIWIMVHPVNFFAEKLDNLWQGFADDKSEYITCPERPWERYGRTLYLRRLYYRSFIRQPFYDTTIPISADYRELNIQLYGYPPRFEDDTKKLTDGFLDLYKPYKEYQKLAKR